MEFGKQMIMNCRITKVIILPTKRQATEYTPGTMDGATKVTLITTIEMVSDSFLILNSNCLTLVIGLMDSK